jgi:dihydroxy-acid dehydratase
MLVSYYVTHFYTIRSVENDIPLKKLRLFSGKGSSFRRAIYKGCGYDDADRPKPLIGIVNTANDAGLGHVHLDRIANRVRAGILQAGGTPFQYSAIATCGAVPKSMPHFRYELVIRDVIASSVEIMTGVQLLDGLVLLDSCDSIIPGVLMGAIRADVPAIIITGGPQEVCRIDNRNAVMDDPGVRSWRPRVRVPWVDFGTERADKAG